MRNLLLTLTLTITFFSALAQDSAESKTYRNEFGIDGTSFIKQFVSFGDQFSTPYPADYYLTYRRLFKKGNIRFAAGGSYANYDFQSSFSLDSNNYHFNSYSINLRIGWEFFTNLSKRWQVFYGLDFRPSITYSMNDATFWNGGYANGREEKTQYYAIAPLLGFRFRFTERLSLSTETSFSLNWIVQNKRQYFIPQSSEYPNKPDVISPTSKRLVSGFQQPLSIFLTFDI